MDHVRSDKVETVQVHNLVPGCNEVAHELFLCIVLRIHLGQGRSCELEPNTRSTRVADHLSAPVLRSRPSNVSLASDAASTGVHVEQVDEEVVGQLPGRFVNTPCCDWPALAPARAGADEHRHLGRAQGQEVRLVHQHFLGRYGECLLW